MAHFYHLHLSVNSLTYPRRDLSSACLSCFKSVFCYIPPPLSALVVCDCAMCQPNPTDFLALLPLQTLPFFYWLLATEFICLFCLFSFLVICKTFQMLKVVIFLVYSCNIFSVICM